MHDGPQTTTGTAYMVIGFFLGGPTQFGDLPKYG